MSGPSLGQRLRGWIAPTRAERQRELVGRIEALTRAMGTDANAAVLWVSRGEALLELGRAREAASDFQRALTLADEDLSTESWGVIAQAVRDRALLGLGQAAALTRTVRARQSMVKG